MRIIKYAKQLLTRKSQEGDDEYAEHYFPGEFINDGIRLKMIREALGWTPKELAEFWECTEAQIEDHEKGDLGIKNWRRRKLHQICNVDVNPLNEAEDPNNIAPLLAKVKRDRLLDDSRKGAGE